MTTTLARRPRIVVFAVVLAILAGACGSGATTTDREASESSASSTAAPTTASTTTTEAPPVTVGFELLTYNVAGLPDALSGSEPATNTALIGPLLNRYDMVLLQESWLTPDEVADGGLRTYHEILVALSEHEHQSVPLPAPLGSDPDRPAALLSDGLNRFSGFSFDPVVRMRWLTCGEASADCLSLKGFSMARTTLADGMEVDIYNLHMDAGREDADIRADNVAELSAFIGSESDGRAVIVAGDFNLHLDRDPDADQFALLLAATGLIDVCTQLGCDQPDRIDKVLVRSGGGVTITPTAWRNEGAAFTRGDGEALSDHDPVAVNLLVSAP